MKKIVALLLTAAVLMSFYGCRGGREDFSSDESSAESKAGSEEKAALDEVRKSDLPCPEKTVALTEEAAKLWLLAGGKLYAVCDFENEIPGLGGDEKRLGKKGVVSTKEVLESAPDYVLLDDSLSNAEELREALSQAGIRCEDVTLTSFDDYFSTVKNFCMMTKNADAYEKAALNVRGRRTAIMRNAANEMHDLKLSLGMEETMESGSSSTASGRDSGAEGSGNVSFELIRVSEDGAVIASEDDWVCSMLEDLGLVNLCSGEESVAVTWKNSGKDKAASSNGTTAQAESGTSETGAAGTAVAAESSPAGTAVAADSSVAGTTVAAEPGAAGTAGAADSSTAGTTVAAESSSAGTVRADKNESGYTDADSEVTASGTESVVSGNAGNTKKEQSDGAAAETDDAAYAKEREAFEKEIGKNPDFIFVIYCDAEKQGKKELDALTGAMKGWKNVKAVKFNHLIRLPKESFCTLPNDAWDLPMEYLYQSIFLLG